MAEDPGYRLSLDAKVRGGYLALDPTITAPAGKTLRYDLVTRKQGRSGTSNTRQGGSVTVGGNGRASLSTVTVSVGEGERCEVSIEVYEGARLVASQSFSHPR